MTARIPGSVDEIGGLVPAVLESYRETRDTVLRSGVADQPLKELCFRYLAGAADLQNFGARAERERVALEWARAIAVDSNAADDDLWRRLHEHFSDPELVDLGCAIGFELGYQHWRRTLGLPARETASDTRE